MRLKSQMQEKEGMTHGTRSEKEQQERACEKDGFGKGPPEKEGKQICEVLHQGVEGVST